MWSDNLLGQTCPGKLFILCAPAGAGKTTLLNMALAAFSRVKTSPSFTTRPRREGEIDGREYHFVSRKEFLCRKQDGEFFETIELHGNFYGTSKKEISSLLASGCHVLLAIDTRGAMELKKHFDAVLIFVKAPSFEALCERLINRGSESEDTLEKRLAWAKKELEQENLFMYSIVNDSLEEAFSVLASILVAETHKNYR